jgi:PTS system mannose-specific IIB component/fructoselysine and glucoselysine-specific PTS system IIB component
VTLVLHRIDDRLIHGQVVVGWGQPLDVDFIVLVDDAVAESDWEQELYRMGVPPHMQVHFLSVDEAIARVNDFRGDPHRGILLTGDIGTMRRLAEGDPQLTTVNVGGIHHRAGRVQRLRYVFLSADEEGELRALASRGIVVSAQDVPAARPVPLAELLASDGVFD